MPKRKTSPKVEIIKAILQLENPTFGDVLDFTGLSDPTVSRYIRLLTEKGLIQLEEDPEDRRRFIYSINPNELIVISVEDVINSLKEDLERVGETLTKDEEEFLREFLIKRARPEIEKLIREKDLERLSNEDFLKYVKGVIYGTVLSTDLMDKIKREVGDALLDVARELSGLLPEDAENIFNALEDFPRDLREKIMKTEEFEDHPLVLVLRNTFDMLFEIKLFGICCEVRKDVRK